MDQKVTPESFKAYRDWERYILSTHPKLPKGFKRATLIAYALAMAVKGTNGLDCYASDSLIAGELEIYRRGRIGEYRRLALELGWFVRTGKRNGRAEVLSIAIPSETVSTVTELESEVTVAEHDGALSAVDCPACKPLYEQARSGKLTSNVESIHRYFVAYLRPIVPLRSTINLEPANVSLRDVECVPYGTSNVSLRSTLPSYLPSKRTSTSEQRR
jgi:hypothetical protein